MNKWKCGICNTGFDNYQAQGFDGVIYCPLCYFKELYKREKQENQQLKKQKDDVVKFVNEFIQEDYYEKLDEYITHFTWNTTKEDLLRMLGEIDD